MKNLYLFPMALMLIGCGVSNPSGPPSVPPPVTQAPPPPVVSNFVPLSATVFLGDQLTSNFPMVQGALAVRVSPIGTIQQIGTAYTSSQEQADALAGMRRLVIMEGTYDVLLSAPCGGKGIGAWDGIKGSSSDPVPALQNQIRTAIDVYHVSVIVGTIPPVNNLIGITASCNQAVITFNSELAEMASANGALVANYYLALTVNGYNKPDFGPDGLMPSSVGYMVMQTVYMQVNN